MLFRSALRHTTGPHARVAACGECAPTVWARGQAEAALQLEHLWDDIAQDHEMDTLCVYPLNAREESLETVRNLCAEHTCVEIR